MSRKKEPFEPQTPGKVSIYSCGPTAHARIHLGEMRRIVFADLLCRYLKYRGYAVNHLTDINDLDDYSDPEVQRLFNKRDKARSEKNWDLADKIRDELRLRGVLVQDQ